MSIQRLQQQIQKYKTPVALGLRPQADRLPAPLLRQFTEMYGPGEMATCEAMRYQGCQLLDASQGKLPAVWLNAESYLRHGAMGFEVLSNLVMAAKAHEFYVIVDCRAADPTAWLEALPQADAITFLPYMGPECCDLGEDKAAFAVVRTANRRSAEVQKLVAGDRRLYEAMGAQMSRHGAGLVVETGDTKDVKDLVRRLDHPFVAVTNASHDQIAPAFDDFGHGGLIVDDHIQFAANAAEAIDQAIEVMKQWVTVL